MWTNQQKTQHRKFEKLFGEFHKAEFFVRNLQLIKKLPTFMERYSLE